MLMHLVQIYLFVVSIALVILAISSWIENYRYERATRREDAARAFAQLVINDRALKGEYDRCRLDDISDDYDILRMFYLQYN